MNPVFQPQTPTFTNGVNPFSTPFPNQFPSPFPSQFQNQYQNQVNQYPQNFGTSNFVNPGYMNPNLVSQACPMSGYTGQGTQIDPIFSNVMPTVRQVFNAGWTNPGWTNPGWTNPGWTNAGWTNAFTSTPWSNFNQAWNGFYPTSQFQTAMFPMGTWNGFTPFQNTWPSTWQNGWQNGMSGLMPTWAHGTTPFNAAPFNPTHLNATPFNTNLVNGVPFGGFMGLTPSAMQGFFSTNFAPTNFVPANYIPANYIPANYIPANYIPANTNQTNYVATNTAGPGYVQPTGQQYTQAQNGYPTIAPGTAYPQQGYQPGYGYPTYAGVSPVTVPTSMDPTEKTNKRTVMSRE